MLSFSFIVSLEKNHFFFMGSDPESLKTSRYFMGSDPNIQKYDIPELQTFINGIKKDLTAVKNGIIYSYNNGSAEGSVNKIKVIKRIMYGRNSFELLKAKVLFGELFHVKFN